MKHSNIYKKIITAILTLTLGVGGIFALYSFDITSTHAAVNKEINYQGKLTNNANVAVADGTYNMEFKLYTQLTGGAAIWTETLTTTNKVQVTNGLFSVMLGSTTPFTGVDFNQTLYLGVKIEADPEMTPRKILGVVPAALVADTIDSISSEQFLRSDTQNATSSSGTFLNILQTGAGKVAEFFGAASQSVLSILSNGNVGIGTTTPYTKLSVAGQVVGASFTATTSTASSFPYASTTMISATTASTTNLVVSGLGGTSTRCLQVNADGTVSANAAACTTSSAGSSWSTTTSQVSGQLVNYSNNATDIIAIGSNSTTTAKFWFNPNTLTSYLSGNVGIGTTSPYARLSVVGPVVAEYFNATSTTATSTFAGGLDVGNGGLVYDSASGITSVTGLQVGSMNFAADAGIVSWIDLPISSATAGTVESYIANVGSQPVFTIYGESDGSGSSRNLRVGVGSTTPNWTLSVAGIGSFDDYVRAGRFIATSSVASIFPYASSTAITVSGTASTSALIVSNSATVSSLNLGSLTGPLQAVNGLVSASSTLAAVFGGTGWSSINSGSILFGNGSGALGTSTNFFWDNTNSRLGIGTSSPYAKLSVVGEVVAPYYTATSTTATSTFAGGLDVGNGGLTYDWSSGITSISGLNLGSMNFDTDAGIVSWADLPISSASAGAVESYIAHIGSKPVLSVYGESDGSGSSRNLRVGIGTTSPWATLSVAGTTTLSTSNAFVVSDAASTTRFIIQDAGNVGIGTTSPFTKFSVAGIGSFDDYVRAGRFTATSSVASTFPYASTTMLSATTASTTNLIISGLGGATTRCLEVNSDGTVSANASACGSGSGYAAVTWSTTTSQVSGQLVNYSNNATDIIAIGSNSTTTAKFWFDPNTLTSYLSGNVGIGTTSPYAMLSVAGQIVGSYFTATTSTATSTFAGGLDVGNGGLTYDWSSGITSANSFQTGNFSFDTNAGVVSWVDLLIDSNAPANTQQSYTANLNGIPMLTIGGISNGNGWLNNAGVGIGTTTPSALFAIQNNASSASSTYSIYIASTTANFATTTHFVITNTGNVGIGTSSPYAKLSVVGEVVAPYYTATSTTATSTFAGGLDVGNGGLTYDWSSGITSISGLNLGSMNFDTDAGIVSWADLPISSASAGSVQGYRANIGNKPVLSVYGESDGSGSSRNLRVGIGTTSPWATLSVAGTTTLSTSNAFVVSDAASTTRFIIQDAGNVGIGTTSPFTKFSVAGIGSFDDYVRAGRFTATSSVASTFPYASTTMISATTASTTNLVVSGLGGASTRCLQVNSDGTVAANASACGSGSGYAAVTWSTTTSQVSGQLVNYSNNATDIIAIGSNSTTTAEIWFDPNSQTSFIGGNIDIGIAPTTVFANAPLQITGNVNGFYQAMIQNMSTGASASSDFVATSDIGSDTKYFVNLGINNSGFNDPTFTIATANQAYLYASSTSLAIGIATTSANESIKFFVGGTLATNEAMRISTAGNIGIGTTSPYARLSVDGRGIFNQDVRANYFTATSTTLASTFPYASTTALTVAGTNGLYLGTLTGPLQAINGAVSATSTLSIIYGGTGLSSAPTYGQLLLGNASGGYTLVATSSLGIEGGGGGYATILDEGSAQIVRTKLNFIGTGVVCTDNSGLASTDCTITPGGGGAADGNWIFSAGSTKNYIELATTSNRVGIGTSTPYSKVAIVSGSTATTTLALVAASNQTANILDIYNKSGSLDSVITSDGRFGIGSTSPMAQLTASSTSATTSTAVFDQRGTGGLLTLQQAGVDKFTVANGGGVSVFSVTTDIVKTLTGNSRPYDFDYGAASYVNTNSTSSNDMVAINNGTIVGDGSIVASTTNLSTVNLGAGAQAILRSDGQYVIIHGGLTATGNVWSGTTTSVTSQISVASAATVGVGAIALKRTDGRYQLVHGGGTAGVTSVFDPYNMTAVSAGGVACGGGVVATGTTAFLRQDGKYVIVCGNNGATNTTSIFDPVLGTFTAGPTGGQWGAGATILPRPDGTILILVGGSSAGTYLYNPNNAATPIGSLTSVSIVGSPTAATGTIAIKRADGKYLIIPGPASVSYVYDPTSTTANPNGSFAQQSVGPSVKLTDSAVAIWRQDGKYTLVTGSGTTVNAVDLGGGSTSPIFTNPGAPLALSATAATGTIAFMLPNGQHAIFRGGSAGFDIYDTGFIVGGDGTGPESANGAPGVASYTTECISNTNLNESSALNWNANQEGKIKLQFSSGVGSCSSPFEDVQKSGDVMGLSSTTNSIKIRVYMKRDLPTFLQQEWGVRKTNQNRYPRTNKDPALYDFSIDNGSVLHKNQFDLGNVISSTTASASGPIFSNVGNTNGLALSLLTVDPEIGPTLSAVNTANNSGAGVFNGVYSTTTSLLTGTASSTLVIGRPDGKYLIITGNNTPNAQLYDPSIGSTTANITVPNAKIGLGALSIKRPDGKFLIVFGNGSTATDIYDPILNTFTVGPVLTAAAGRGATVIPLTTGRVLIVHGNISVTSSIYDPIQNVMVAGPRPSANVGSGAMAIPNADGTYLFIPGQNSPTEAACVANTATNIFDPYRMLFTANTGLALATPGTGPGAYAFQRKNGQWQIIYGAATAATCAPSTATAIYDPVGKKLIAGTALTTASGLGGHAIPRPDGNWLLYSGSVATGLGSRVTNIFIDTSGAYTATNAFSLLGTTILGPTTNANINSGAISFQRDDGKFVTIAGAATTTTAIDMFTYDGGWVDRGTYRSEEFDMSPLGSKLDSNSTLVWKTNNVPGVSVEVRTAPSQAELQNSTFEDVAKSGNLINPNPNDVWLQINFNFRRKFPSYGGIYTDVWYSNSGSNMIVPQRAILIPTVTEFKVTKDKNLIDLKADGLSMFRVSSAGDVFTQAGATINTSGADLAERYTSDEQLDFGDVVSIDSQNNHNVKRSKYQYQNDIIGVVSTDPGFVAGAYTENSYPIALIGRVPVKVSTENGMIRTGDALTSASVPGYAMKASLAGRVLGTALESIDPSKLEDCPASDIYVAGRKCTTIMVFVNLMDSNGTTVGSAMDDWKIANPGLAQVETSDMFASSTSAQTRNNEILNFLIQLKTERDQGILSQSEIFADRISAVTQVISPELITNLLNAKAIQGLSITTQNIDTQSLDIGSQSNNGGFTMNVVDGKLSFFANPIVNTVSNSDASTTDASSTPVVANGPVITFDSSGNAFFAGDIIANKIVAKDIVGLNISAESFTKLSQDVSNLMASSSAMASSTDIASTTADMIDSLNRSLTTNTINVSGIASTTELWAVKIVAGDIQSPVLTTLFASTTALEARIALLEATTSMNFASLVGSSTGLTINGNLIVMNGLTVDKIGSNTNLISLTSDVEFIGRPYFTTDTAGFALVKKGDKSVEVLFSREYLDKPIVNASISFDEANATDTVDVAQTASAEDAIFRDDIRYIITKKSAKGFTIMLNKSATGDVKFSWMALAVKSARTFESNASGVSPVQNQSTATTTITVIPSIDTSSATTTSVTHDISTTTITVIPSIDTSSATTTTTSVIPSTPVTNIPDTSPASVASPEPTPSVGESSGSTVTNPPTDNNSNDQVQTTTSDSVSTVSTGDTALSAPPADPSPPSTP